MRQSKSLERCWIGPGELCSALKHICGPVTSVQSSFLSPKTAVIVEGAGAANAPLPHVALEASVLASILLHAGWEVKRLTNATPELLHSALQAGPHLLIVLAHTDVLHQDRGHTVGFTGDDGMLHVVDPDTIVASLKCCMEHLELVMLAGCKSDDLGRKLAVAGVRQVQCWETLVSDRAAHLFDLAFLKHWLARGLREAMTALEQGIAEVEGRGWCLDCCYCLLHTT